MDRRVSTRRVDELVQAMGMSGISKSSVSKLCKDILQLPHGYDSNLEKRGRNLSSGQRQWIAIAIADDRSAHSHP